MGNLDKEKTNALIYLHSLLQDKETIKKKEKKKKEKKKKTKEKNLTYLKPNPLHISLLSCLVKKQDEYQRSTMPYYYDTSSFDSDQCYNYGDNNSIDSGMEA